MSFNFALNFGFFAQTSTYGHAGSLNSADNLTTTNESGNIQVTLYPRWYKHIAVQWSVPADWGNCLFNVYFSQVESSNFEKINPTPIDGTYLLDTGTEEYRKFNRGFYIVEAILLDKNNVTIKSVPATWSTGQGRWVELRSIEIQRREYTLLSKFNGLKSYLFRRKTYGERCPDCWSTTTEKIIRDHCETCMGTGFKGGYFEAAPCYMNYDSTPNALARTYFGIFEPDQISAWTISLPEIRPDDIVLRAEDWNVYRVENMVPTELRGKTVRQIVKLTQLSKNDVENQLITREVSEYPDEYL